MTRPASSLDAGDAARWPSAEGVTVGRTRLSVRYRRGAAPTVVFEAGLGLPAALWKHVWERLPPDSALLCYDRAGLGASEPLAQASTAVGQAQHLRRLLGALRLPPPYVLVGHSAGAFVVRLIASERPYDVVGLVLLDPSQETGAEDNAAVGMAVSAALRALSLLPLGAARPLLLRAARATGGRTGRRLDLLAEMSSCAHVHGMLRENDGYRVSVRQLRGLAERRARSDVPVGVVTARSSIDRLLGGRRWRDRWRLDAALAGAGAGSRHVVADNSSHLVPLDTPELVAEAVQQVVAAARRCQIRPPK